MRRADPPSWCSLFGCGPTAGHVGIITQKKVIEKGISMLMTLVTADDVTRFSYFTMSSWVIPVAEASEVLVGDLVSIFEEKRKTFAAGEEARPAIVSSVLSSELSSNFVQKFCTTILL